MKVFFCHSGGTSQKVAQGLKELISLVIQQVQPFFSEEDITKGQEWKAALSKELNETSFGILCLTGVLPDNLTSPWIHFEGGAIFKGSTDARVCTYVYKVPHFELKPPLSDFQYTKAEKEDTLKLLQTLNKRLPSKSLESSQLEKTFGKFWPEFEETLRELEKHGSSAPKKQERTDRDLLIEILEEVRELKKFNSISHNFRSSIAHFGKPASEMYGAKYLENPGAMPLLEALESYDKTMEESAEN